MGKITNQTQAILDLIDRYLVGIGGILPEDRNELEVNIDEILRYTE